MLQNVLLWVAIREDLNPSNDFPWFLHEVLSGNISAFIVFFLRLLHKDRINPQGKDQQNGQKEEISCEGKNELSAWKTMPSLKVQASV